jgi:Ca2+-binding RTX toxin-like protein
MPLTAVEQLILELVNRARLDPAAEAARLGIKLNEGLKAGSISSAPKDVLASNDALHNAADAHSQFMLDQDEFAHQGIGDGTPQSRTAAAGYASPSTLGENIAFRGTTGAVDETAFGVAMYRDLFVDKGIAGRGHRLNILNESFREIGVGEQTGVFSQGGNNFNSSMLTQDFGTRNGAIFVTGVAITDANQNAFYDVGEGIGGIGVSVVAATMTSGTTEAAGGYAVAYGGGPATVTFSGGGLAQPIVVAVNAGTHNVKVDLLGPTLVGSSASTTLGSGAVDLNLLGAGNLNGTGNSGDNAIIGTRGANVLDGAGGADTLVGGLGHDTLTGGTGADSFVFDRIKDSATGAGHDQIIDFSSIDGDIIDLSAIDANSHRAGDQPFHFIGAAKFHSTGTHHVFGELRYAHHQLKGDVNGDGHADFAIAVNAAMLSAGPSGDFLL